MLKHRFILSGKGFEIKFVVKLFHSIKYALAATMQLTKTNEQELNINGYPKIKKFRAGRSHFQHE